MKKSEYEMHYSNFLKVREILHKNNELFALSKGFKKPIKWYGQHSIEEAVEILRSEASIF